MKSNRKNKEPKQDRRRQEFEADSEAAAEAIHELRIVLGDALQVLDSVGTIGGLGRVHDACGEDCTRKFLMGFNGMLMRELGSIDYSGVSAAIRREEKR